jgi:hypothetical protein
VVEVIYKSTGEVRKVESAREQKLLRLLDLEERRLDTMQRISEMHVNKSPNLLNRRPDDSGMDILRKAIKTWKNYRATQYRS